MGVKGLSTPSPWLPCTFPVEGEPAAWLHCHLLRLSCRLLSFYFFSSYYKNTFLLLAHLRIKQAFILNICYLPGLVIFDTYFLHISDKFRHDRLWDALSSRYDLGVGVHCGSVGGAGNRAASLPGN